MRADEGKGGGSTPDGAPAGPGAGEVLRPLAQGALENRRGRGAAGQAQGELAGVGRPHPPDWRPPPAVPSFAAKMGRRRPSAMAKVGGGSAAPAVELVEHPGAVVAQEALDGPQAGALGRADGEAAVVDGKTDGAAPAATQAVGNFPAGEDDGARRPGAGSGRGAGIRVAMRGDAVHFRLDPGRSPFVDFVFAHPGGVEGRADAHRHPPRLLRKAWRGHNSPASWAMGTTLQPTWLARWRPHPVAALLPGSDAGALRERR